MAASRTTLNLNLLHMTVNCLSDGKYNGGFINSHLECEIT